MSEREKNIKRLVARYLAGEKLEVLDKFSRDDLKQAASIPLAIYERNHSHSDSPILGDVTLGELRVARRIWRAIQPSATH
jgi:hypothetical protein